MDTFAIAKKMTKLTTYVLPHEYDTSVIIFFNARDKYIFLEGLVEDPLRSRQCPSCPPPRTPRHVQEVLPLLRLLLQRLHQHLPRLPPANNAVSRCTDLNRLEPLHLPS
jgi:hypothetical protein